MYCQRCGFYNNENELRCARCYNTLTPDYLPPEHILCVDLLAFSYIDIVRSFKVANPVVLILSVIIVSVTYAIHRLTNKPYLMPVMNALVPKEHPADDNSLKRVNKNALDKIKTFLGDQGFVPLIDVEDRCHIREIVESMYINRQYGVYASVIILKASGHILSVSFTAITTGNKVVSYTNAVDMDITDDRNVCRICFPNASPSEVWNRFSHDTEKVVEQRICPESEHLFPILYYVHKRIVEIGLQRGVLHIANKKTGAVPAAVLTCAQHASAPAVRRCTTCETAMCEACYEEINGEFYCKTCASRPDMAERKENRLKAPWGFAGLGVRLFATAIDALIVAAGIGTLYGLLRLGGGLLPWRLAGAAAFTLGQIVVVGFILIYFIVPVVKSGRTPGKRLWGLRVIDIRGGKPGPKAAVVRFAGGMISLLFIFPVIGYFLIPFRKNKRGFNDLLADTLVVTKHSGRKTLLAWVGMGPLLAVMLLIAVVAGYRVLNEIRNGGGTVALPKQWEIGGGNRYCSFDTRGDECLMATDSAVVCFDMASGDTLWKQERFRFPFVECDGEDVSLPLLVSTSDRVGVSTIHLLDDKTGAVQWSRELKEQRWWRFTFDSTGIAAYSDSLIYFYTRAGDMLWKKRVQFEKSTGDSSYMRPHLSVELFDDGIVVSQTRGPKTMREKWCRRTGKVMVPADKYHFRPFYCGKNHRIVSDSTLQWTMVNCSSGDTLWTGTDTTDYPLECTFDDKGNPQIIYGRKCAYHGLEGTVAFTYPDSMVFEKLLDTLLLVADEPQFKSGVYDFGNRQHEWRFIDPLTGEERFAFSDTTLRSLIPIGENDRTMFFAARPAVKLSGKSAAVNFFRILFPSVEMKKVQQQFLVKIDKKDFSTEKIYAGSSIGLESAHLFPESDRIFICGSGRAGLYQVSSDQQIADASVR